MRQIISTLFFAFLCSMGLNAQVTSTLIMNPNPPTVALDWLNEPQPIKLIVSNLGNSSFTNVQASLVVTNVATGVVAITADYRKANRVSFQRMAPTVFFGTQLFNQNSFDVNASQINLSSGAIKPGNYRICIKLHSSTGAIVVPDACANFQVTDYQEPTLQMPLDKHTVTEAQALGMVFRWTPVTPNYKGLVKYRFLLYEIPNRMTAFQAVQGSPIEQFDATGVPQFIWTQAPIKINQRKTNGVTSLRYAWRVQSLDAMDSKPIGKNAGTSKGFSDVREFMVTITPTGGTVVSPTNTVIPPVLPDFKEPVLIEPLITTTTFTTDFLEKNPLTFKWSAVTPLYRGSGGKVTPVKYKLLIYRIRPMGTVVDALKSTPSVQREVLDQTQVDIPAGTLNFEGKYIWRVQALDSKTNGVIGTKLSNEKGYSDSREFSVKKPIYKEPTSISPITMANFSQTQPNGVVFKWNAVTPQYSSAVKYRLLVYEIQNNKYKPQPLFQEEVTNATEIRVAQGKLTNVGNYGWQIQALDATTGLAIGSKTGLEKGFTERREFVVKATDYTELTLTAPVNDANLTTTQLTEGINFQWSSPTPAYHGKVKYVFYLYEKGNVNPIHTKDLGEATSYVYKNTTATKDLNLQWNVKALDAADNTPIGSKSGVNKGVSDTRSLTVKYTVVYKAPELIAPTNEAYVLPKDPNGTSFQWTAVTPQYNNLKYDVLIYKYVNDVLSTEPSMTFYSTTPTSLELAGRKLTEIGKYAWKVKAYDAKTYAVVGLSNSHIFNIQTGHKEPTLNLPKADVEIEANTQTLFRWSEVTPLYPSAVKYRLLMYEIVNGKTATQATFSQDFTNQREVNVEGSKLNKVGKYSWKVQALDADNNAVGMKTGADKGFSESRIFSIIKAVPKYSGPFPSQPANNSFKTEAELSKGFSLVLTGNGTGAIQVFEVDESVANETAVTGTPIQTIAFNNNDRKAFSHTLAAGSGSKKYVWRFKMGDFYSTAASFTVKATSYAEPKLLEPLNNPTYSTTDARKGMTFLFQAVTPQYIGTEKYLFKVYEITEGKTVADALKTTPVLDKVVTRAEISTNFKRGNIETGSFTWKREKINPFPVKFVWQIQAVDATSGKAIGVKKGTDLGFSDTQTFTIGADDITEPTLATPAANGKVTAANLKEGLVLSWKEVSPKPEGTVKYRVKVYEIPKGKTIADTLKTTPSVNELLKDKLEYTWKKDYKADAKFVWNVQALDAYDKPIGKKAAALKGFSENGEFALDMNLKDDTLSITDCNGKKTTISNKGLAKSSTASDFKNKFVKINEFSMLITEFTGTASKLSGKGSIVVSWLKSTIAVEFQDIEVNPTTMTLTNGNVFAVQDADASELPNFLKKAETKPLTKVHAKSLNTKLKANNNGKLVKDRTLDEAAKNMATNKASSLPLGINNEDGYTVAISEMRFSLKENKLVGIGILPYNKDNGEDVLSFAASDIVFDASSPTKSGVKMVLLEDFNFVDPSNNNYGVTLKAKKDNKDASFIEFDCKGFKQLKASVDVAFPRSWMTPVKEKGEPTPDEKVIANATTDITKLNDWLLELSLSPCEIQGLDDVELSVKKIIFDNSDTRNDPSVKFPKGYAGTQKADFRGFYIQEASLTLPKFYKKGSDTGVNIGIDKFIITKQGISGEVAVGSKDAPIVSLKDGTVGDFQASIESVQLEIVNMGVKNVAVNGKIVLPISSTSDEKPNALTYSTKWQAASGNTPSKVQLTVKPDGKLGADFIGGSEMTLLETSVISMTYTKGKTKADKGKITAEVKLNGNVGIEKKLMDKIPVNMKMKFEGLGFSYDNSKTTKACTFSKGKFSLASPQKSVGGFPVTLNDMEVLDDATTSEGYWASATLKFNLILNLDDKISGKAGLEIQGGIKKKDAKYTPSVIGAKITEIDVNANVSAVSVTGKIKFYNDDPTFGDGFTGEVSATFAKAGQLTAAVRYGSVKKAQNPSETYRYWYVEGKMMLKKPIPLVGVVGLKGFGVAAWYHMTATAMPEQNTEGVADAAEDKKETKSGATFKPDHKTLFGFNIGGVVVHTGSDRVFNGNVSLSAEFADDGAIKFIQLSGEGYLGAGLKQRAKAPIKGTLVAKYDFTQDIFDLNVKVDIKYPIQSPVPMFKTIKPATFTMYIEGKTGKWAITVGTPANPNELQYYGVDTWAYFRAGNNLVVNSSFQPKTLNGLQSVDPNFKPVKEPLDETATGGKGFDFGIGFNKNGGLSVGPFSGSYDVGAELNLSMAQYEAGNGCVPEDFNYWYARGGIAAWATAGVSFKGLVSATIKAAAMMQGGGPEPLWVKGRVAGKIGLKIFIVRININASVPFSYGSPCKPKKAAAAETESFTSTDEIGANDLVELGDMLMHKSGATDRLSPVTVISPFDLSYGTTENTFQLEAMENGTKTMKTYKVDLEWFIKGLMIKSIFPLPVFNNPTIFTNMNTYSGLMKKEGEGYSLGTYWYGASQEARNSYFSYNYTYETYVIATMKVKNASGQWEIVKNKEGKELKQQTKSASFTTHNN